MASAPIRDDPRLSVELFRGFIGGRPEEERWELIDGLPVMMAPPTRAHQRIASNLERLLNDALEAQGSTLAAYQAIGVNLGPRIEYYDPEPDVAVVDTERDDERYSDIFYLAAEVVSSSDRTYVESKREVYKLHEFCKYILTIQQDRVEVRMDARTEARWDEQLLNGLDDVLTLPAFGLLRRLSDLYRGTWLARRQAPSR
jgi:Uma2 family endonuclease